MASRTRPVGAVLLTPGAGSSKDHPSLVATADALAPWPVERVDFPYRKEGRRAPDRAPKLIESVVSDAGALVARARINPRRLALGGRSMGGRICSMAVAEGLPAAALVLVSYPLHPPGRPDKLRIEHFPSLRVPCLFLSGTKDAFGSPGELEEHTAAIPGQVTHHWIDRKGHDLSGCDAEIASVVAGWLRALR